MCKKIGSPGEGVEKDRLIKQMKENYRLFKQLPKQVCAKDRLLKPGVETDRLLKQMWGKYRLIKQMLTTI